MTDLNEDLKIIGDVKVTPRRAARTAIPNRIFDARPVSLDSPFAVACVADRNARKRRKMEDTHCYVYDYKDVKGQGLFCIYDGHAGLGAAKWCEDHFSSILGNLMDQNEQRYPGERIGKQRLLNYAFMEADAQLAEDKSITSGCTVAVALFKPPPPTKLKLEEEKSSKHRIGTLYTANVGDGRIVLCQGGRAIRLSYDHKASDKREQQRIMEAGGFVAHDRVSGVLAVTRSLGDEELKEFVIGRPYTTKAKLTQESQFLIIACDGLWDVCGDQQACDLIQNIYAVDQLAAATRLVDFAIQAGSADNISVMVIAFKEQKTV